MGRPKCREQQDSGHNEESIVHRNKDIALLQHEMQDEGEDEEIEFLDEGEYEIEDWEEEDWE